MKPIRLRLHLYALLAIGVIVYFSAHAYKTARAQSDFRSRALESLEIRSVATSLLSAPADSRTSARLAQWRKNLDTAERRRAIYDVEYAISMRNPAWLKKQTEALIAMERQAYEESIAAEAKLAKEVELDFKIVAGVSLAAISLIMFTIRKRVFKPLDRLSRRMMDFLVDRYSFQFSRPEASELGELQRTFNSLAQRVINTMDELKSLDQAKSEFLNIASHELRTPLTSIKGSLSLLDSGVIGHVDPSCMRLIKIAETETDRLIRLINDLLDLAKIEAGKLPLVCSWLSWDEVASKTAEGLGGLAVQAEVQIKVDAATGLEVFIDRDRIQQVLTNLISNAVKFSPAGSWVHVTIGRTQSGEALVSVRDQGPGISEEDRAMIFQKFRQGNQSGEQGLVKGTGLGLAIAKALIAEHGGEIGVNSEVGQGSVFWFTLPKWRDDESSSDEAPAPGKPEPRPRRVA